MEETWEDLAESEKSGENCKLPELFEYASQLTYNSIDKGWKTTLAQGVP